MAEHKLVAFGSLYLGMETVSSAQEQYTDTQKTKQLMTQNYTLLLCLSDGLVGSRSGVVARVSDQQSEVPGSNPTVAVRLQAGLFALITSFDPGV